jgi:hypothetical protein
MYFACHCHTNCRYHADSTTGWQHMVQGALQGKLEANPKLAEFMELMKPRSKAKTYANDELALDHFFPGPSACPAFADSADDHLDDIGCVKIAAGQRDRNGDSRTVAGGSGGTAGPQLEQAVVADDVLDDSISDLEYLKRRVCSNLNSTAGEGRGALEGTAAGAAGSRGAELAEACRSAHDAFSEDPATRIRQTGRLFIRNLPFVTTDEDIVALCTPFGVLADALVVKDKASRRSKGFALVSFVSAEDAVAAFNTLDASIFQGRLIHVLPGNRPNYRGDVENNADDRGDVIGDGEQAGGCSSNFKVAKEAQRKADAGNRKAWSTFYMREDTVLEAIADLTGISKAEMVGGGASSAAVQLALGEAQVRRHSLRAALLH